MTITAETAVTVAKQGGSDIPARPPQPVDHAEFLPDYQTHTGLLDEIWDTVEVIQPVSEKVLKKTLGYQGRSSNVRLYAKYHGITLKQAEKMDHFKADEFAFAHEVKEGLRLGHLLHDGEGRLIAGPPPPEHIPLSNLYRKDDLAGLKATLVDVAGGAPLQKLNEEAIKILTLKDSPARVKPTREGRARLKKSLQQVGQLTPIVLWKPFGRTEPIVVDGHTRAEILEGLGKDPWENVTYLPKNMSVTQVLQHRFHYEWANSSKDMDEGKRDDYIGGLTERGMKQDKIAELLDVSQARVSQVLAKPEIRGRFSVSNKPTQALIDDWVRKLDDGWSERDIAQDVRWSKTTIHRYVEQERLRRENEARKRAEAEAAEANGEEPTSTTPEPEPKPKPKLKPLDETNKKILKAVATAEGPITASGVAKRFGRGNLSKTSDIRDRLVTLQRRDLVVETGKSKQGGTLWKTTHEGDIEAAVLPDLPEPEAKSKSESESESKSESQHVHGEFAPRSPFRLPA